MKWMQGYYKYLLENHTAFPGSWLNNKMLWERGKWTTIEVLPSTDYCSPSSWLRTIGAAWSLLKNAFWGSSTSKSELTFPYLAKERAWVAIYGFLSAGSKSPFTDAGDSRWGLRKERQCSSPPGIAILLHLGLRLRIGHVQLAWIILWHLWKPAPLRYPGSRPRLRFTRLPALASEYEYDFCVSLQSHNEMNGRTWASFWIRESTDFPLSPSGTRMHNQKASAWTDSPLRRLSSEYWQQINRNPPSHQRC